MLKSAAREREKHWVLVRREETFPLIHFEMQSSLFFFPFFLRYITVQERFKAKSSADSFTFHQQLLKTPPKHRLSDLSSIFHAGICISKKHIRDVCAYRSKRDCTQPAGTLAESYGEFMHKMLGTTRTDNDESWREQRAGVAVISQFGTELYDKSSSQSNCFMFIAISCLITGV